MEEAIIKAQRYGKCPGSAAQPGSSVMGMDRCLI